MIELLGEWMVGSCGWVGLGREPGVAYDINDIKRQKRQLGL
jgi:hypothetical protein